MLLFAVIYSVSGAITDLAGASWLTLDKNPVQLFGHRGMKSQQPEHTVGSYSLAIINGIDYVEPDLVLTKEGIPVCYHDLFIRDGTDVLKHPEFAHLQHNFTGLIYGKNVTLLNEFFISDFTLTELQTLRVVQKKVGVRPSLFDGLFHIPTFQEYLEVVAELAFKQGRAVNIVPELKHPAFYASLFPQNKHYFEDLILNILPQYGYPLRRSDNATCFSISKETAPGSTYVQKTRNNIPCGKVVLQSFDAESLQYISTKVDRGIVDLVMLNDDNPYLFTRKGLERISRFATWFGPWKEYLYVGPEAELKARKIKWDAQVVKHLGGFIPAKEITAYAHQLNMKIVLYTFYDSRENSFRGCAIKCEPQNLRAELRYYFDLGVDGLFVENTSEAIQLRTEYHTELRLNATKH